MAVYNVDKITSEQIVQCTVIESEEDGKVDVASSKIVIHVFGKLLSQF